MSELHLQPFHPVASDIRTVNRTGLPAPSTSGGLVRVVCAAEVAASTVGAPRRLAVGVQAYAALAEASLRVAWTTRMR
ncbi:hypothetical protein [Streptomyces sp. NBC_01361]|uniref:hypothetical protein n=1 Tax=Streptomyces sp. NBC_01361 TaxID=2903838 RepID=UPI002E2EE402|nr:hypothetical protein [Streptomyces sp. NBC_01361]